MAGTRELSRIEEAVAALPGLPPPDPTQRYGVHRLTATWLAGLAPHTRRASFRDLAHFLTWCQRDGLDPRPARAAALAASRAPLEPPAHQPPTAPATGARRP